MSTRHWPSSSSRDAVRGRMCHGLIHLLLPILLLPLILRVSLSASETHFYVKPTEGTTDCPVGEPCFTLDHYVLNTTKYFSSDSIFEFIPGNHSLRHSLVVSNRTNIALNATGPAATIVCSYGQYMQFSDVSNLTLVGLNFSSCGVGQNSERGSVVFHDVFNLTLYDVAFYNPLGMAISARNVLGTSVFDQLIVENCNLTGTLVNMSYDDSGPLPDMNNTLKVTYLVLRYHKPESSPMTVYYDIVRFNLCQANYTVDIAIENLDSWYVKSSINRWHQFSTLIGVVIQTCTPNTFTIAHSVLHFHGTAIAVREDRNANSTTDVTLKECNISGYPNEALLFDVVTTQVAFTDSIVRAETRKDAVITENAYSVALSILGHGGDAHILLHNITFQDNQFLSGQVPVIFIHKVNKVTFSDCSFYRNVGRSILYAYRSQTYFNGTIKFVNNTGDNGGAVSFEGSSHITIYNNSNILFQNNCAEKGGAIFIQKDSLTKDCLFKLDVPSLHAPCTEFNSSVMNTSDSVNVTLSFINNTARLGGDAIYGDYLDQCNTLGCTGWEFITSNIIKIYTEPNYTTSLSFISSDPTRVCPCYSGKPNCSQIVSRYQHYPGEPFNLSLVVVGDRFGTHEGTVFAQFLQQPNRSTLSELQYRLTPSLGSQLQFLQKTSHDKCVNLTYSVLSENKLEILVFNANDVGEPPYPSDYLIHLVTEDINAYNMNETISQQLLYYPFYVNVTLLPCPLGFVLGGSPAQCHTSTYLQSQDISCDIETQTCQRKDKLWINVSFHGTTGDGILVGDTCLYCKPGTTRVNLEQPDEQCDMNRAGILCGRCRAGYSLALGSNECLRCGNAYLALLLPFALALAVLVFLIKILNLTIAVGTINGLIFYANVLWADQASYFPAGTTSYVLSTFIAWLNLDLGIKSCFVDGFNAYWKTWVQFNYTWAVIFLLLLFCHFSSTAARILGNNSVPVLSTLLLLSYTKLLRTIIIALTFSRIVEESSQGTETRFVWSADGTIEYFGLSHSFLGAFAILVLLILFLPYTLFLLSAQNIQKVSIKSNWVRHWILRLKPFIDAYGAPFKDDHRYWAGLLLVARMILLIVFISADSFPAVKLLAVIFVGTFLLAYAANLPHVPTEPSHPQLNYSQQPIRERIKHWTGPVYRNWLLSLLESSYILNLLLLAATTLCIQITGGNQTWVVFTSVFIAFCQFVGTVIYHSYVELKRWREKRKERHDTVSAPGDISNHGQNDMERSRELSITTNYRQFDPSEPREPLLEYLQSDTY